jgi:cytochrome b
MAEWPSISVPNRASLGDARQVRVWDPLVRVLHWVVAGGVVANLTFLEHVRAPHRFVGYVVIGAATMRAVWGFVASGHAKWSSFVPGPRRFTVYVRALAARRDPRYVGHNPAGAAMSLFLMISIAVMAASGWMMGNDRFWGVSWVEQVHKGAANVIIVASAVHIAGAIIESVRHRENLVWSMMTGYKRAATGTDVDHAPPSHRR